MSRPLTAPPTIATSSVQGTLALEYERPSRVPELRMLPGGRTDLDLFAQRFAHAVVEVIGGDRGPQQLLRWTNDDVYADLVRRCATLQRVSPPDRRVRRLRAQVRSVRVYCPSPEAAELSIHVRHGHRSRAIAARLDLFRGHWCCTALQFG